jgi:hypothetical protein
MERNKDGNPISQDNHNVSPYHWQIRLESASGPSGNGLGFANGNIDAIPIFGVITAANITRFLRM